MRPRIAVAATDRAPTRVGAAAVGATVVASPVSGRSGGGGGFVWYCVPIAAMVAMLLFIGFVIRFSPATTRSTGASHLDGGVASGVPHIPATAGPPSTKHTVARAHAFVVNTSFWGPHANLDALVRARTEKHDWRGEPPPAQQAAAEELKARTGCDVITVPFSSPTSDKKCIDYMTDTRNWVELVPLAMRYDARTIKFQVKFADARLHSILKMPQRLFSNEAFSEVAAFHADRVLGVNRIPPTGWVCIPLTTIRNATETFGARVETEEEFLKDSGVSNYKEWIQKDLMDYATHAKLIDKDERDGAECIGASIQLHMADVHHLLDSPLKIPYKAHNASWHRYFDLTTEDPAAPLKRFIDQRWAPSIVHIAELTAFDFIVGNGDRSPNKNNFIVGKCNHHRDICDEDTDQFNAHWIHPGPPTYVHLDQGMAFYETPRGSPLTKAVKSGNNTFCIFRAPMLNRLAELASLAAEGGQGFESLMTERLPRRVRSFVTKHSLRKCQRRIEDILEEARRCLARPFGPAIVAP